MANLNARGLQVAADMAKTAEIMQAAKGPASGIEVTRGNYSYYASVIVACCEGVEPAKLKGFHFIIAEALVLAGAPRRGVDDAMHAMLGYAEYDHANRLLAG